MRTGVGRVFRNAEITPDTWLPTCTVTSAESVPVAVTFATTAPRSAEAVSNLTLGGSFQAR